MRILLGQRRPDQVHLFSVHRLIPAYRRLTCARALMAVWIRLRAAGRDINAQPSTGERRAVADGKSKILVVSLTPDISAARELVSHYLVSNAEAADVKLPAEFAEKYSNNSLRPLLPLRPLR